MNLGFRCPLYPLYSFLIQHPLLHPWLSTHSSNFPCFCLAAKVRTARPCARSGDPGPSGGIPFLQKHLSPFPTVMVEANDTGRLAGVNMDTVFGRAGIAAAFTNS